MPQHVGACQEDTNCVCEIVAPHLKLTVNPEAVNSVTRGLVGDSTFAVLPEIAPRTTFFLTLGAQIVSGTSMALAPYQAPHEMKFLLMNPGPAITRQTLFPPDLGQFCCDNHALWLCILPLWLARSRESDPSSNPAFQPAGAQGSALSRCISTTRCRRACELVSTALHGHGISHQGHIYNRMADSCVVGI
jgi:hypothetical protein